MNDLVAALMVVARSDSAIGLRLITGTVTQASPLLVRSDEAAAASAGIACKKLGSYTPVLAHRVAMLVLDNQDRLVLANIN